MALINCPECGKEMSDKALRCPNCGYERKKKEPVLGCLNCLSLFTIVISLIASIGGVGIFIFVPIFWFFIYSIIHSKYKSNPLIDDKGIKHTKNIILIILIIEIIFLFVSATKSIEKEINTSKSESEIQLVR